MNFIFTLFAVIIVFVVLYQLLEYLRNISTSEASVHAILVDKSMDTLRNVDATNIQHNNSRYYLLFELDNGERLGFYVYFKQYKAYAIGDSGTLRYQRKKFNSLDR